MTRKYSMTTRSKQAAETKDNIIATTEQLLINKSLKEINLKTIAEEAGTSVQTLLRHFENREGCLNAVASVVAERVEIQRGKTDYKNIESAISDLVDHYETEGTLVLNLLAQEKSGDIIASQFTRDGRAFHKNWVEKCFGKYLSKKKKETIDELIVATDIYTWKILRLDLKRNQKITKNIITDITKKILEVS